MSVIKRYVTGHEGGLYEVTFWEGKRFTIDRANMVRYFGKPYLYGGIMTFCGIPLPIEWVERRINRIIAREERKRGRVRAREAEIKARWVDEAPVEDLPPGYREVFKDY